MEFKISQNLVEYPDALDFMNDRVDAIHSGDADECVWFLEHPPLYTAGTSSKDSDLLDKRFPVYEAGRGGEYTYHGPGQRIAYVMLDLKKRQKKPDIKKYVWQLEEWIIQTLAEFDIVGERRCGRVGIWVDRGDEREDKIAAIGVRIRRWVTMHGIAINVNPDLSHFGGIVPCGISEHGVTSFEGLGNSVSMLEINTALQNKFTEMF